MGLPTFARDYLKQTYSSAFSFDAHGEPTICVYDLMKDLKYMPDSVKMLDDAILYIVNKVKTVFLNVPTLRVIIVCVDRKPPVVKRMVTHTKRYKNKDVFEAKGAPYLPVKYSALIPTPWIRFAGNYKLLQRELYPRLFNAFMDGIHFVPPSGRMLVLHGFPGYCEWETVYKQHTSTIKTNERGQVKRVHLWRVDLELPISKDMERDDPDMYNRVFVFENIPPCEQFPQGWMRKEEWAEAKNDISEADSAMFYYDHWFPNETFLLICNDGDIFSYGLLYTSERVVAHNNTFRNNHIACLPYKKKENEYFAPDQVPQWEYCDMNKLYVLVKEDASMKSAGVQNHVVTLVFLLIMAGSDFFKDYMKGIGEETVIWRVFFSNLRMFSHMVQSSKGVVPHTRTAREIVLDEDLFRNFTHYCYIQKYGKAARKESKTSDLTYEMLDAKTRSGKKAQTETDYHLPDRNKIRLWARQVEWNLLYYKNSPFGLGPDPFEEWDGLPYYPYVRNPQTGKPEMSDVVAARRKPVDEVYAQHFQRRKKKHDNVAVPQQHKQAVLDAYAATKNAQGKRGLKNNE